MADILPIEDAEERGNFFFIATLDGSDYLFFFRLNAREGYWYFDLLDFEGEPVQLGTKVVSNMPLLLHCTAANRPPGELFAVDTSDHPIDPGRGDLGVQVSLAYLTESEL